MSGTHLKGTHEVVTKGGGLTIKGAFYCGVYTLRDSSGYPSGGSHS